jgi:chromosome segregation ATPase
MNISEEIKAKIESIGKAKDATAQRLDQAKKDVAEITRYYNQAFKTLEVHELKKRVVFECPLAEFGKQYAEWELERQKLELAIKAYQERLKLAGEERDRLDAEVINLGVVIGGLIEDLRHVRLQNAGRFL